MYSVLYNTPKQKKQQGKKDHKEIQPHILTLHSVIFEAVFSCGSISLV